jgi:predicted alpha/beta superfamily hydrolase
MKNSLTIPRSETHKIRSKINNIEYELFVNVPLDYRSGIDSYPVIFTTDPDFIFTILLSTTKSLASLIPEAIIVGIGHGDLDFKDLDRAIHNIKTEIYRPRDFLPWKFQKSTRYLEHLDVELEVDTIKHSGHAEDFKNFISSQVIPFIDATYRTKPEKTLIGHSFGGIFASWIALNHSAMFENYLIVSPILDFEDHLIFNDIANISKTLPRKIYLAAGSREAFYSSNQNFLGDLERFYEELKSHPNITTKMEIFADEFHASVVPFAVSRGLRFIYSKE